MLGRKEDGLAPRPRGRRHKGTQMLQTLAARLGLNWRGMTQTVYSMGENGRNPCSSVVSIMQTLTQLRKLNSRSGRKCVRKPDRAQSDGCFCLLLLLTFVWSGGKVSLIISFHKPLFIANQPISLTVFLCV